MTTLKPLLLIAVIGLVCWLLTAFLPLPYPFGMLIIIAGVILCVVLILRMLGVWDQFVSS